VLAGLVSCGSSAFGAALLARHDELAPLLALLAIGICGAAAAYALDEEAGDVADASPTSRPHRVGWRLVMLILPAAVSATALLSLHRLDARTPWLHLLPVAAGSITVGVAVAAGFRRSGNPAPGDLAGVVTLLGVVLVVLADPLRHWVSLSALGAVDYPIRTAVAWLAIVLGCVLTVTTCEADPGRSRHVPHRKVPT
jgi:hypothetical protein